MVTPQPKATKAPKVEAGMPHLTDVTVLPERAELDKAGRSAFKSLYTTGPFLQPQDAGSLDWALLNNDASPQKARVTVFKCPIGAPKVALPPGPLVVALGPGETTHNANTYPAGFYYEVTVESNSQLVFPYVSVWPGSFGVSIPGTGINSGTFVRLMP